MALLNFVFTCERKAITDSLSIVDYSFFKLPFSCIQPQRGNNACQVLTESVSDYFGTKELVIWCSFLGTKQMLNVLFVHLFTSVYWNYFNDCGIHVRIVVLLGLLTH